MHQKKHDLFESRGMDERSKVHIVVTRNLDGIAAAALLGRMLIKNLGTANENMRITFAKCFSLDQVELRDDEFVLVIGIQVHRRDPQDTFELIERIGDRLVTWYDNHKGWFEFRRRYSIVDDGNHVWLSNHCGARFYVQWSPMKPSLTERIQDAHRDEFTSTDDWQLIIDGAVDAHGGSPAEMSEQGQKIFFALRAETEPAHYMSIPIDSVFWLMGQDDIYAPGVLAAAASYDHSSCDFELRGSVAYLQFFKPGYTRADCHDVLREGLSLAPLAVVRRGDSDRYEVACAPQEVDLCALFGECAVEGTDVSPSRISIECKMGEHEVLRKLNTTGQSLISLDEAAVRFTDGLAKIGHPIPYQRVKSGLDRVLHAQEQFTVDEMVKFLAHILAEITIAIQGGSPKDLSEDALQLYRYWFE